MEELNLTLNHTYLIKYHSLNTLNSITVLMITDKAYHLRWNNGLESNQTWETKEYLDKHYSIIEDISDFIQDKSEGKYVNATENITFKYKYVPCYVCKGFGTVPNDKSTAGTIPCPACNGNKIVTGSIET